MTVRTTRRQSGAHRKQTVSATRRMAITAFAVSAFATSSSAVANAAPKEADSTRADADTQDTSANHEAEKTNSSSKLVAADTTMSAQEKRAAAPKVLAASSFNPTTDLNTQLTTALQYNKDRITRDLQARAPQLSLPTHGVFTSPFGPRWGSFHSGVDIANSIGTPILAVMDGTVIDSGPAQGYGQWIRIRHDDGSVSLYGHMETLMAAVGERVTAGQQIAGMGSRGFSTGSHLHFEIHPDGTTPVDPVAWFLQRGINLMAG